jgi:hypothetical protein
MEVTQGQRDAFDLVLLEGTEVAIIALDADVSAEEAHHAPAQGVAGLVGLEHVDADDVDLTADEAHPAGDVRPNTQPPLTADGDADDNRRHQRRHTVVPERAEVTEEVVRAREVQLGPDDAALHAADADAPRQLGSIVRGFVEGLAGVAAEIHPDEGDDEAIGERRTRRPREHTHHHRCLHPFHAHDLLPL